MFLNSILSKYFAPIMIGLLLVLLIGPAQAVRPSEHVRLMAIVDQLTASEVYERSELEQLFAAAEFQQSVLDAMKSPAEYKLTWGKYRKIFIQDERIEQGVDFWLEHASALEKAESKFGVPASMIVAILGVESKFGRFKGKHKVLDSLVTLVMGFERRSKFFASELKEFLILAKENQLDATKILGSYAGAVGFPQFIASSYRNYAVDFNGDGRTDLIDQPEDAIGSIANYFLENGWRTGQPVTSEPHRLIPEQVVGLASRKRKTRYTAARLRSLNAPLNAGVPDDEQLGVLMLNASEFVPDETQRRVYLVRAGDTACEIAEAHQVSCRSLSKLNKLNSRGDIFRGQRLDIPAETFKPQVTSDEPNWRVSRVAAVGGESAQAAENREQPRYFFTHHNFYVITRYNQSVLYAMAVNDLAEGLMEAHKRRVAKLGVVAN